MPERVLLTNEDRALLTRVSSLLEEIVETLSVLEDKETMTSIKQAEKDVKAGRARDYYEFLKKLKQSYHSTNTPTTQKRPEWNPTT
jgi:acyl-CoA reductase-like NAD-dependent aldehyde dehydrogenase